MACIRGRAVPLRQLLKRPASAIQLNMGEGKTRVLVSFAELTHCATQSLYLNRYLLLTCYAGADADS